MLFSLLMRIRRSLIFTLVFGVLRPWQAAKAFAMDSTDLPLANALTQVTEVNSASVALPACGPEPIARSCDEPFGPVGASDSPNRAYFEALLKKGMSAPISDFLRLWYPANLNLKNQAYFFSCESQPWGALQADASGSIPSRCAPDVLYSWGPRVKLETMKKQLANGAEWKGSPNPHPGSTGDLWLTISPSSSFSYGLIPIRVKIKPGVRFTTSPDEKPGIVNVPNQQREHLADFVISDASVIESWSYGNPELYDEIVKDILQISSGNRAITYNLWDFPGANDIQGTGLDRLYKGGTSERGAQSEETLKRNLLELIRMILAGDGRIHYASGTCHNRIVHFSTLKATYFSTHLASPAR